MKTSEIVSSQHRDVVTYTHPLSKRLPFFIYLYFSFLCVRLFEFVFDETPFEEL